MLQEKIFYEKVVAETTHPKLFDVHQQLFKFETSMASDYRISTPSKTSETKTYNGDEKHPFY